GNHGPGGGEKSSDEQMAEHIGRQRPDGVVHAGTQRRPPATVPTRNVISRNTACGRERTAGVKKAAHHGKRINVIIHSGAEGRPTGAIPLRDAIGCTSAGGGEEPSSVEIGSANRHRPDNVVHSQAKS